MSNKKVYYLGVIVNDGGNTAVVNVKNLEKAERNKFIKSVDNVRKWLDADFDSYSILEHAYDRLYSTVQEVEQELAKPYMPDVRKQLVAINSDFLSFLSMMRLYLDHYAARIGKSNSRELADFNAICSGEFNNYSSYKIFSQLRNFAQHRGMPITGISGSQSLNKRTGKPSYRFELYFNRDELLSYKKAWKKEVREAIEASPKKMDVLKNTTEVIHSIDSIRLKTFPICKHFYEQDAAYLLELLELCSKYKTEPLVYEMEPTKLPTKANLHGNRFPLEALAYYRALIAAQ